MPDFRQMNVCLMIEIKIINKSVSKQKWEIYYAKHNI